MPGRAPHRSKSEKRIQNFWTGKDIECHVDLPLWPVGESGWAVRRRRRKKEGRERLGDLSLPDLLCFSLFTCLVFLFAALIWAARYFPNQRNSKLRNCFVLFCFVFLPNFSCWDKTKKRRRRHYRFCLCCCSSDHNGLVGTHRHEDFLLRN